MRETRSATRSKKNSPVTFGIVAQGRVAVGVVAMGGVAIGFISIGAVSIGGVALGGVALGALALGGLAVGWKSIGAVAIGLADAQSVWLGAAPLACVLGVLLPAGLRARKRRRPPSPDLDDDASGTPRRGGRAGPDAA
jgi:hypothetical protein